MNIGDILTKENYTKGALWCNQHNAHIEKQGEQYIIVENEVIPPAPIEPTEMDRLEAQVMYTALLTDTLLEVEDNV